MSLHNYVDRQVRKLGGAGLYLVVITLCVYAGRSLPQLPFYGMMALGAVAHIAGHKAYLFVTT